MKLAELEKVMLYFLYYSRLRLLGEHIPYAIEAWPARESSNLGLDIVTKHSKQGQRVQVKLHGKTLLEQQWDGAKAIEVRLPE